MTSSIRQFLQDDTGATAIEYALIASFISMSIVVSATAIGTTLSQTFASVSAGFAP